MTEAKNAPDPIDDAVFERLSRPIPDDYDREHLEHTAWTQADLLSVLQTCAEDRAEIEKVERYAVALLREFKTPWQQIAATLGLSKHQAMRRFQGVKVDG